MPKVQQSGALNIPAGATTTQTGPDIVADLGARGVKVVVDTTAIGTGSITLTIQGKDKASGKYYTLLAGAAIVTNTTNVYTVFPGAPVAANVSANDGLPEVWRLLVTANNANPATYTVGWSTLAWVANLIVNPGAESGTTGWSQQNTATITQDATHVFSGSWAFKLVTPGVATAEGMQFDQSGANIQGIHPSTAYTLSAQVYSVAGGERIVLALQDYTAANVLLGTLFSAPTTLVAGWNFLSMTYTTGATAGRIEPYVTTDNGGAAQAVTIWVDQVLLPDGVAAFLPQAAQIRFS